MAKLPDVIANEIARIVAREGLELLSNDWLGGRRCGTLRLVVDKEAGVSIDDCERVSKMVGAWLDVEDPFPGSYRLEVSSAGLDRLFYRPEDYRRFTGRDVRCSLLAAVDGKTLLEGTLRSFDGERITIENGERGRAFEAPISSVRWARLAPDLHEIRRPTRLRRPNPARGNRIRKESKESKEVTRR